MAQLFDILAHRYFSSHIKYPKRSTNAGLFFTKCIPIAFLERKPMLIPFIWVQRLQVQPNHANINRSMSKPALIEIQAIPSILRWQNVSEM